MEENQIIWTKRAANDLKQTYNFYCEILGEQQAFDLILKVIARVEVLSNKKFSKLGAIDEEFVDLKSEYRKLIEGDIKITYRLSASKPAVYINRIFDTRQNPSKNR